MEEGKPPRLFRPRVLTLGQQQQRPPPPPPSNGPAPATAPSPAPAPAPSAPPAAAVMSSSSLWRRHETGSYKHYYFRRKSRGSDNKAEAGAVGTDARLALLKEEWFRGKSYMDIGTNTGKVAWEVYQHFKPARVLGIDIDPELISTAQTKLKHACRRDNVDHAKAVVFACRDFVAGSDDEQEEDKARQYDVITCLSVAKHIHLQGGDAALLRLFHRVHRLLRSGGRFILEPQPWRSYRKRKHASAESARHFSTIRLRPPFSEVLLGEVGFASMEELGIPPNAAEGYQRPLYCFVKAERDEKGEAAAKT